VPQVAFLLVPQLHLLDLAGPAQVFSTAAELGYGYELRYVAEQPDVPTAQGLRIHADLDWPALGPRDLIVVPGWLSATPGSRWRLGEQTARILFEHHAHGGTVASVCMGAFALGQAGLLNGRRCTTHHAVQDKLARCYPRASAMLRHRSHLSDTVHRVQDLIDARFAEPLPLAELALVSGVSQRTLTRIFVKATGLTPLRYQQLLRAERAEHLIAHGATVEAAARAAGFREARMLRRLRARSDVDVKVGYDRGVSGRSSDGGCEGGHAGGWAG